MDALGGGTLSEGKTRSDSQASGTGSIRCFDPQAKHRDLLLDSLKKAISESGRTMNKPGSRCESAHSRSSRNRAGPIMACGNSACLQRNLVGFC